MGASRLLTLSLSITLSGGAVAGCAKPSNPVKVSGKVVDAKGRAIPALGVHFFPMGNVESFRVATMIEYPIAVSDKAGAFTLAMNNGDVDGALPGKYRVMLVPLGNKQQQRLPLQYQRFETSPLVITIPDHDVKELIIRTE